MLEEEVRETASSVGKFDVAAAEDLVVRCYVEDGFCIGFDLGGSFEEEGWGELVDVMVVDVFGVTFPISLRGLSDWRRGITLLLYLRRRRG